jgi:hypothetical protein
MTIKKRGKQSAEDIKSLASIITLPKRIEPAPADMPADQAAVWRYIMASHAGDLITDDVFPILQEYCRCVCNARKLGAEVDRFEIAWAQTAEGLQRLDKLNQLYERAARLAASMATKLRLTVQARSHPVTAGRHVINQPYSHEPPWEFTGE